MYYVFFLAVDSMESNAELTYFLLVMHVWSLVNTRVQQWINETSRATTHVLPSATTEYDTIWLKVCDTVSRFLSNEYFKEGNDTVWLCWLTRRWWILWLTHAKIKLFELNGALVIPDIKKSLLSFGQLTSQCPFDIDFSVKMGFCPFWAN